MNTNEIENIKKKSKSFKSVLVVIAVVAILSLIGFAFARYITQLNGNTEAQIARWNFNVTAGSSQNLDIDLSQTRFENDTQEVDRTKVAPGTSGALVLNVNATNSQVSLKYDIDIDLTEIPENLIFYSNSNMTNAIYKENGIIHLEGYFDQVANNKTEARTLYWQWPIETGSTQNEIDANDLLDSNWIGTQPEISISVTGRQVMQEQETNRYAVTFDANGGTLQGYGNSSQATKIVTYGEEYGDLPTPTREGYRFLGWTSKNLFDSQKFYENGKDYNVYIDGEDIKLLTYAYQERYTKMNLDCIDNTQYKLSYNWKVISIDNGYSYIKTGLTIEYTDGHREPLRFLGTRVGEEGYIELLSDSSKTIQSISCGGWQYSGVVKLSNIKLVEYISDSNYITNFTSVTYRKNHTLTAMWEPISNP